MNEKTIARKYLQAIDEHESSWDNQEKKYLSKKDVKQIFAEKLSKEEQTSGFAQALYRVGETTWNDMIDICNAVESGETIIP